MAENEKNKSFPFRLSAERRQELKIIAARRSQSLQEMLEDGLRLLLDAKVDGKAHPLPVIAPKAANARWHAMLDVILQHATPQVSALVKQVLEIHSAPLAKRKGV